MASNLALWQVDPFFSAAEEVQNSADRMESAYRSWKHMKSLVGSSPHVSTAKSTLNARKRELVTALDTVKWQLEEFERAVEFAIMTEQVYLGENAPSRHREFVRAIQSQVSSVSSEVGDTFSNQVSQSASKNAQGENANDLTEFLLGSRSSKSTIDDFYIQPIEAQQQPYQDGQILKKNLVQHWGVIGPSLNGFESVNILTHESREHTSCSPQCKTNDINIRIFEEDYAPSEFSTSTSESKSEAKGRSSFQHYASSEFSTSTSDGQSSDWPAHSLETQVNDPQGTRKIGSFGFSLGFWRFWRSEGESGKLQVSRRGFKRWKDGDASFGTYSEERVPEFSPMLRAGYTPGIEKDFKGSHTSENFDAGSNGYTQLETSDLNDNLPCGFRGTIPSHGLAMWRLFSSVGSPTTVSAVFAVLILVGLYFWFISTFLPEDTSNLPGDFLH